MKVQYWKDGILMGLVSLEEAKEIMENARKAGYKVNDKHMPMYFTVETETKPLTAYEGYKKRIKIDKRCREEQEPQVGD